MSAEISLRLHSPAANVSSNHNDINRVERNRPTSADTMTSEPASPAHRDKFNASPQRLKNIVTNLSDMPGPDPSSMMASQRYGRSNQESSVTWRSTPRLSTRTVSTQLYMPRKGAQQVWSIMSRVLTLLMAPRPLPLYSSALAQHRSQLTLAYYSPTSLHAFSFHLHYRRHFKEHRPIGPRESSIRYFPRHGRVRGTGNLL